MSDTWAILMSALPVTNRERVIFALANQLQHQHPVQILIPKPWDDQKSIMAHHDLTWHNIAPRWARFIPGNAARLACSIPHLRHLIDTGLGGMLTVSIPTALAALRARQGAKHHIPLLIRQSNVVYLREDARFAGIRPRWRDALIRRWYPEADHFIAVSRGVADNLLALGIESRRITVIPNAVDVSSILQKSLATPSPYPQPYLVAVGRLVVKKDYPTLLHAMSLLPTQVIPHLVILGEGPERRKLTALCHDLKLEGRVSMPGFVANPYPIMAAASCLVSSSISEGMPNALLEALVLGRPVVATNCPSGPAEILDHGRYGALVPVGQPEALAVAIGTMLANPSPPELLQARAAQFSMDVAIQAYARVIHHVLGSTS